MIDLNEISSLATFNFLLEENFLLGLNQEIILYKPSNKNEFAKNKPSNKK
jgi:hypothetical protein